MGLPEPKFLTDNGNRRTRVLAAVLSVLMFAAAPGMVAEYVVLPSHRWQSLALIPVFLVTGFGLLGLARTGRWGQLRRSSGT